METQRGLGTHGANLLIEGEDLIHGHHAEAISAVRPLQKYQPKMALSVVLCRWCFPHPLLHGDPFDQIAGVELAPHLGLAPKVLE